MQRSCIGYVRVSSANQATEGVSLDAQEARIRAWAASCGYEVQAIHVDAGLSGGRADNRPALQEALRAATKGQALVVFSLSRLARSTTDAIRISRMLEKSGVDLVSLSEHLDTTTASGRMMFKLLAVLAEFERELISERTRLGMAHLKRQGRRVGTVPFGSKLTTDGKMLVEDPAETVALAEIGGLREQGMSYRKIAGVLDARGIHPKKGLHWHREVVRRLVGRLTASKQARTN